MIRHLGANRKIHKIFGGVAMATLLVGAFSVINANDYSTLTIAAKADKSTKATKSTSGGGTDKYAN